MSFLEKRSCWLFTAVGLCPFFLAVSIGLTESVPSSQSTPKNVTVSDFSHLKEKLGDLKIQLLTLQQQPLKETLRDPRVTLNRVEVYLSLDDGLLVPEKIELQWNGKTVMATQYSHTRQAAVSEGGIDKLITLESEPGMHLLEIHYTHKPTSKAPIPYEKTLTVQKKNALLAIVLRPHLIKQGLVVEQELLEGPISDQMERWLDLWYRNAIFYYHLRQFSQAASLLLTCLESQGIPSKRAELLYWLGRTYLDWGLDDQAIQTFQQLIGQFPSADDLTPRAWFYLQKARYLQGHYQAVTAAYHKLNRGLPPAMLWEVHYLVGQSFLYQKDYAKAIMALNQVPKGSEHYPYVLYALGLAYLGLGDTYAAQQTYKKLIDLDLRADPSDPSTKQKLVEKTRITLGFIYLEQNRHQEAISVLERIPSSSPFFDQALFGIGWSYLRLEEYVKAIVVFRDLTERFPYSPYSYEAGLMTGHSFSKLKAYAKAVDSYRQALKTSSDQISTLTEQMEQLHQKKLDFTKNTLLLDPRYSLEESDGLDQALKSYLELTHLITSTSAQVVDARLMSQMKTLERQLYDTLQRLTLQSLNQQRQRLEDLSIQASIGIAKNLVLEKTDFGGEELVLE